MTGSSFATWSKAPAKVRLQLPRDWENRGRNSMAPTSLRKTFLDCKMAKYFKERFTYVSKGSEKIHNYRSIKKKTTKLMKREGRTSYSLIFKSKTIFDFNLVLTRQTSQVFKPYKSAIHRNKRTGIPQTSTLAIKLERILSFSFSFPSHSIQGLGHFH